MAGEYEQASLLQRIAAGGVDVAGTLLKQYREGAQWQQEQQAAEQKSKLTDIAIKQGQQQIESTNLLQKQKQLEVDKLTAEAPYFTSDAALENQTKATQAGVAVLDMNLATLKLNKEMDNVPIEERAGHLQSFKQILTQLESLPPEQYSAALASPDLKDMKDELYLTGDKDKDTPMRKAGLAAADAVPELQKAKMAAESAKYVADVGLQKTAMTVAGRERTTQIMADAKVRASTTAAGLKGIKVTKADTDTGVALVVGSADTNFPGVKKEGLVGMGAQVALLGNAIMKAGNYTQAEAYEAAYTKVKGAFDFAGGDLTEMQKLLTKAGLSDRAAPSLTESLTSGVAQPATGGTTTFTVRGKTYNIPNDKVDEFKKDMGIK